jgi:hypothetical protein
MGQPFRIAGKVVKYDHAVEFGYIYAEGIVASVWNYQLTPINDGSHLWIFIESIETGGPRGSSNVSHDEYFDTPSSGLSTDTRQPHELDFAHPDK